MDVRHYLKRANMDQISLNQLFHLFAKQVPDWVVVYQATGAERKPFLAKGDRPNSFYVVAYTDEEAINAIHVDFPQYMEVVNEPALSFLIKAYRSPADGVILNPGHDERLFLIKPNVQEFIRSYAVEQFRDMPGPWVPTMDGNLLLVEYEKDHYTVTVYLSEEDAEYVARKSGGQAVRHSWEKIEERCRQLGAPAPYFHFGLPEQSPFSEEEANAIYSGNHGRYRMEPEEEEPAAEQVLPMPAPSPDSHAVQVMPSSVQPSQSSGPGQVKQEDFRQSQVSDPEQHEIARRNFPKDRPAVQKQRPIDPDVAAGLKKLEKATIEGQGMGNGWEVCRAMAELRRIWVVVDPEGNMVILAGQDQSPIVDFFTSSEHAKRLIDEALEKNPNLPPMVPRLISTKKLYRALAPRQPIVWINRGSAEAWTSIMGDTLPYVLQLMSQMQAGKI
ncbi:hypothetical protein [Thermoactinomyces mirandus]|uniref:SseB protein N-terminal domain-containing protein n=1 Tax=Thermoactinomyces mirandus TaxID=2756294 RepID=A0A7W1XQR8_9BACL|nr:hypothetical protein [Thermoactinomyces mirandus]MBA4601471.1 hypothetical protein [Thermoactinomyces mirandus]